MAPAKFALKIAVEQGYDEGKMSFTWWTLGAQLLAHRKYEEALSAFDKSREHALKQKTNPEGAAMCSGYIGLVKILSRNAADGGKMFDESIAALDKIGNEDALFYAKQLRDVRLVFERRESAGGRK